MAGKRNPQLQGAAAPVLAREPLFLRACAAFVNNLPMLLRVAFLVGAVWLAGEFRRYVDVMPESVAEAGSAPAKQVTEPELPAEPLESEPVITERVQHYLNCTFEEYRLLHYDECVEEPSRVYEWRESDADDTGHIPDEPPLMVAGLAES